MWKNLNLSSVVVNNYYFQICSQFCIHSKPKQSRSVYHVVDLTVMIPMHTQGGTPYNGLYREAPPEVGSFFRLQVYEKIGISLVEVHERRWKSVISVCQKG